MEKALYKFQLLLLLLLFYDDLSEVCEADSKLEYREKKVQLNVTLLEQRSLSIQVNISTYFTCCLHSACLVK